MGKSERSLHKAKGTNCVLAFCTQLSQRRMNASNASNTSAVRENVLYEGTSTIVIYVCIGTVGILGNALVICVLTRSATLRKNIVNILLINQSALDLAASVCLVTMGYNTVEPVIVTFSGFGADLYCRIIGSKAILWGFATCSTWNLVTINLERYISVSFPVWHKTSLWKRHVAAVISFVWIFGLLFTFCTVVLTSKYSNNTCLSVSEHASKELSILSSVSSLLCQFVFPIAIMIFCHINIIGVVRQKAKIGIVTRSSNNPNQDQRWRNILKTLALVSLTFIICWSPNTVVYALFLTKLNVTLITTPFYHFTVYLVYLNCCFNPLIYAAQYKDFQREMKKLCCGTPSTDNVTTGTSQM